MDAIIIKLKKPIETPEGHTLTEIEVQPPTGAEMWQLDKLNAQRPTYRDFVQIVSVCQKLPLSTVKAMDGADIVAIANELWTFLAGSLPIGGNSGAT